MTPFNRVLLVLVALGLAMPAGVAHAQDRSVGRVIDDAAITTQIKAKLTADKLSNLTRIEVKTEGGVVTLNGTVDSADRAVRAEQTAGGVKGVRAVVNNLHVAGTTVGSSTTMPVPAPGVASEGALNPTGIVSSVDPTTGTITLQDGRVLRTNSDTALWQPGTLQSLRPGSPVLVQGAVPVAAAPPAVPAPSAVTAAAPSEWRTGTVRSVDRANYRIMLTDGTVVRLSPSASLHRGLDRVALEQLVPGSQVAIRTLPPGSAGPAEGSALPGQVVAAPVIDAAEVDVVATPAAR